MPSSPIPLPTPDVAAAAEFWAAYGEQHPEAVRACPDYTVEYFGDHADLADELLGLVRSGRKRATAELLAEFGERGDPLPRIGSHWIACDGRGRPSVILRTVELRIGDFESADAAFARDEGEDDGSLEAWRTDHRRYWERTAAARGATWSEGDEIVFERFEVVWPPESVRTLSAGRTPTPA